jgi:phenylalanyl-tRNA synthetase beta chain
MKVPLSWLREYVQVKMALTELAHRMTMAGVECESIESVGGTWENVYVGRVLKVEKHPNADRLKLATVDYGLGTQTVVCGAPNVAAGQKIAFARLGARLVDPRSGQPRKLEAARIRGVVSEGMVCSEKELGLGDDHEGILVLPEDAPVGTPLQEYLGDAVLDFSVTPNRSDCLSILGIAREVAALTGETVKEPDLSYSESGEAVQGLAAVEILDSDLCPRYIGAVVTNVKVGPSPQWMQDRLARAGMRPINNIVDITNYVMLEYGQPLHAFDLATLREHRIIARRARPGEGMVTLDGVERKLDPQMLVIADAQRPVAIAGVMGGGETEVTGATTTVLLESASFVPLSIRRTASALKLRSEASHRFERGLSPELPLHGLRRAMQLFVQVAGATAARGILDVYPGRKGQQTLPLTMERVRRVLGDSPSAQEVADVLGRLGFQCQISSVDGSTSPTSSDSARSRSSPRTSTPSLRPELKVYPERSRREGRVVRQAHHERDILAQGERDGESLLVTVPYWRTDISLEDDLIEEYARITGYDSFPTPLPGGRIPFQQPQPLREVKEQVRDALVGLGLQEVITYSLVGRNLLDKLNSASGLPEPLGVANPLSAEQECLRTTLRASLLATLAANQVRHLEGETLHLFELGRVYQPRKGELPEEREIAIAILAGAQERPGWAHAQESVRFYDAKGLVESLLAKLHLQGRVASADDPDFLPGRCASVTVRGEVVGVLGEVHPQVLERFDISVRPVLLVELDLQKLASVAAAGRTAFQPLPRYPVVSRDLALVVDQSVPAEKVEQGLRSSPLVAQVLLFDVYQGEKVLRGKKSLAFRLFYQAPDRTLTSQEVNQVQEQLLARLERELGAKLRS